MKKVSIALLIALLCFSMFQFMHFALTTSTIIVPDDYPTIQGAINAASDGDTIFVMNGTYFENVVVNKTLSLIGQDRTTTCIAFPDNTPSTNPSILTLTNDAINVINFTLFTNFQSGRMLEISNCSNVKLEKCSICTGLSGGTSIVQNAKNITLEDCQISSHASPALVMQNTNSSTIEGCRLEGSSSLAMIQSNENRISRIYMFSATNNGDYTEAVARAARRPGRHD